MHSRSWPGLGFLGLWAVFISAIIALAVVLEFESAARENPGMPFPLAHLWFPGIIFALGLCGVVAGPEALYGMYGAFAGTKDTDESVKTANADEANGANTSRSTRDDRDGGAPS